MDIIEIDGKKEQFAKKYIKSIKDEIGEGRYLQSPKDLMTKHLTQKEGRHLITSPFKAVLQLVETFYGRVLRVEDKGSEEYGFITGFDFNKDHKDADNHKVRYYESVKFDNQGQIKEYYPEYFSVGGSNKPNTAIIQQEQWKLYWFLSEMSRKVKGSKNEKVNTRKDYCLEFAFPEKEATEKRVGGRGKRKAEFLIMEESADGGFSIEQLELIGRLIGLSPKSFKSTDLLRDAILTAAGGDETARALSGDPLIYGYEYIIALGEKKGPDQELRELIAEGISEGFVAHDRARKHFVWKLDGNIVGNICPVDDASHIKNNVLLAYLKNDQEARERLEKYLKKDEVEETSTLGEGSPPVKATKKKATSTE